MESVVVVVVVVVEASYEDRSRHPCLERVEVEFV